MSTVKKIDEISKQTIQVSDAYMTLWKEEIVFTWQWWFGVTITFITWLLWLILHKKESRYRLLSAGFFVGVVSVSLDTIGVQMGLWAYRYDVLPFIPAYVPYDLSLMPVVIMGLIQLKPRFSPFLKGLIFAVLTTFVGEPLIYWIGIYDLLNWKMIYSLPIYFIIYFLASHIAFSEKYDTL
ncbi:hypothetical protein HF072_11350 [Bacillus sp. RO3]|nr:hypothetical protein [Bacillus sp. RO3]